MAYKIKILHRLMLWILAIWTLINFTFALWATFDNRNHAKNLAYTEAVASIRKDLAFRQWVSSHGGVYVPTTQKTPPNPYLAHIKKRDIISNFDDNLTLMNPAYTLRQIMENYSQYYGKKSKLTSTKYLSPHNAPDTWEIKALGVVEKTKEPFYEIATLDGKESMRLLNPLFIKASCLKCHGQQGYKVGDLRGGISVAIGLDYYYQMVEKTLKFILLYNFIIWLIGVFVILWGYKKGKKYIHEKITIYEQNIYSLIDMIEKRDRYTAGHGRRVAHYSKLIAQKMGMESEEIELLYKAGMLHDIGKIAIPDSILLKPEHLNDLEYSLIQEHVQASYELLNEVDIFKDISNLVRHHHEHYDGNGYPNGLKNDEIPLASQIMSFCDAFDAMTTDRIYKGRKSIDEALIEAIELKGKQFHPQVVDAACEVLKDIELIDISQEPQNKNEEERFSYFFKDQLTSCYNHSYLKFLTLREDFSKYHAIYIVSLHNLTQYNKKYGWDQGDKMLKEVGYAFVTQNPNAVVIRVYGDDFIFLFLEETAIDLDPIKENILKQSGITISLMPIPQEQFDIDNLESVIASLE